MDKLHTITSMSQELGVNRNTLHVRLIELRALYPGLLEPSYLQERGRTICQFTDRQVKVIRQYFRATPVGKRGRPLGSKTKGKKGTKA